MNDTLKTENKSRHASPPFPCALRPMPCAPPLSHLLNPHARRDDGNNALTEVFSPAAARAARRFHESFPEYAPTPLAGLTRLARDLGISDIRVKDESGRFGLKAFKVLGASYGVAHLLNDRLGLGPGVPTFDLLLAPENRGRLSGITLVTATDGNHGRAVAWIAHRLGCRALVFMPEGTVPHRIEAIRSLDAEVRVIRGNYDAAVNLARQAAGERDHALVQDTAWMGYEEIPTRIMQGYLTLMDEAIEQMEGDLPSHVFVQCGVGSLAGALCAYLAGRAGRARPLFTVVEPNRAACLLGSIRRNDRRPHRVTGDLDTIMAGLACGEPSLLGWNILRRYADAFLSCSDLVAERGMRILANPPAGDDPVVSGESGAVTLGALAAILRDSSFRDIRRDLGLDAESRVLLFSTEGDTDPVSYRKILASRSRRPPSERYPGSSWG
ncbi:MAG: diaminopropionate ammonia-lyase [Deltaproteobacteria bacterium]|nr:diaminopropionate ammonia-lyase [Deltaproteobacteria bacterium]